MSNQRIPHCSVCFFFTLKRPFTSLSLIFFSLMCTYRNSRSQMFCKVGVLKNFTKFIANYFCQGSFVMKLQEIINTRFYGTPRRCPGDWFWFKEKAIRKIEPKHLKITSGKVHSRIHSSVTWQFKMVSFKTRNVSFW